MKLQKHLTIKELKNSLKKLQRLRIKKEEYFFLGVGGSAGNCSHDVNDFRKLCKIECYSPVDNVSELTARINDEGWNSSFAEWLKINRCSKNDAIFIMSVGGGNLEKNVSVNLIEAIKFAKVKKMKIFGIVGKPDSYTEKNSDVCIVISAKSRKWITPQSEAFQAIIWHCLVSNPNLQEVETKW